jgi:diguanylate cyclase (GGDEF)-like protein/PAS domain S-box-containing protein
MSHPGTRPLSKAFHALVIALGIGTLLYSIYYWPASSPGIPLLLLALTAIIVSSRYTIPIPRGRGELSVAESFCFLAILLFGAEASVLFATLIAFCIPQRTNNGVRGQLLKAAVSAISTFLIAWTLRLTFEPLVGFVGFSYSSQLVKAITFAVLIQSFISSTLIVVGGAYKIKQSIWRTSGVIYFWTFTTYFAGAVVAIMAGAIITAMGFNVYVVTTLVGAILFFAFRAYLKCIEDGKHTVERLGAAIKDNSERFRSAFNHSAIGMALVSPEGRWLQVNRSLCALLGYSEPELMATDYLTITHPDDLATALTNIRQLLKGKIPSYQTEKRYIHKQGQEVWVAWNASLARDEYTGSAHLIFQIQDITDRKRAEERLLHDAFHDSLTGLPNRALFMDHLKMAIARTERHQDRRFAVLYLDLDRFKIINDSLGHMIGDQLLVGIATRLKNALRPIDTIARFGGDEFTILVEDIVDENEVIYVAERLQYELSAPFSLSGREVFTTVSIGIALSSIDNAQQAEEILRDADTAMYRAKTLGKTRYEIFDVAMHAQAVKSLQLETDLRRALEREEFFIQYQPIISLDTFNLSGFEALVRWKHPEHGSISPAEFIPVAEETGLIIQIGEWVLREACYQMQHWHEKFPGHTPLFLSVNLSVKQFNQPDLIEKIASIIRETGLAPQSLKLEITESAVSENIETVAEMMEQIRAIGVELSMDDFGTGYSSLSHLHRFPLDTLKIDRSFISLMQENDENMEIVRTIVGLAQNLGMVLVAEGVETYDQITILRKLGCEYGQGYFFSKPIDTLDAASFIAEHSHSIPKTPVRVPQKRLMVA